MKYPLYTYSDGTEVTVSSVQDGKVRVCTERFDADRDMFFTAIISIPDGEVLSSTGYPESEVRAMVDLYTKLASDIIDYVAGRGDRQKGMDETSQPKNLNYYMSLPYKLVIIPDAKEGGFTAVYPELPGCLTCAETLEQLVRNAEEAKRLWLEAALEDVGDIPEPSCNNK